MLSTLSGAGTGGGSGTGDGQDPGRRSICRARNAISSSKPRSGSRSWSPNRSSTWRSRYRAVCGCTCACYATSLALPPCWSQASNVSASRSCWAGRRRCSGASRAARKAPASSSSEKMSKVDRCSSQRTKCCRRWRAWGLGPGAWGRGPGGPGARWPGGPGAGSGFLAQLNAGGDTVSGVSYMVIESRDDEVVTPYTSAFLMSPGVTDITVQNQCPLDQSDHLELVYDPVAMADMLNALNLASRVSVPCVPVLPVTGPVGPVLLTGPVGPVLLTGPVGPVPPF